ncbi:hypothetical protein [Methylobacter sp.]|nr:hypothetical protein [Methylobacter sp.]
MKNRVKSFVAGNCGAAGVTLEDREDLLGHHAGHITTHYSKVEITRLIE